MNRSVRRTQEKLLRAKQGDERRAFATGRWPPWETKSLVYGEVGSGWCAEFHTAYHNTVLAVLHRTIQTEWGPVEHLAIRNATNTDVPWAVKQRIKDELIGLDKIGIEVFPKSDELVDNAELYHIWVMPDDFTLPFSIVRRTP